ncbi:MAG: hypothetical protein FWB74_00890 [Defluviitaleaceae bacterium]|nr:hypothetical protein [Defluviitaleaceae bacterium]
MSEMLAEVNDIMKDFTPEQVNLVYSYVRFINTEPTPLDEFDYEMARLADLDECTEVISFDDALKELGLTYEDLRD